MLNLNSKELIRLIQTVFPRLPDDRELTILVDIPTQSSDDHPQWQMRRRLAYEWFSHLRSESETLGLGVSLRGYPAVNSNNADLPSGAFELTALPPDISRDLNGHFLPFEQIFKTSQLFLAPTQFSTTAPLKVAARQFGFRAATMPGFSLAMLPALRVDYQKINQRCLLMKEKLDRAISATVAFVASQRRMLMNFDLRHRSAHVSSGLFLQPGMAGNLPSGETYIVPYEGELDDDGSRTEGVLPVQFGDEIVLYQIEKNRAVQVISQGAESDKQAEMLAREPAFGNIAELGFGILGDMGVAPIGEILLDEKLGVHVAFGRSDHFGGAVGPKDFSSPQSVVHIDRIYVPQLQNLIHIDYIDLRYDAASERIMENHTFTIF